MSNSFEQPSAFESVLRYLGRPGYAVRNALRGNVEGSVRQIGDIIGDTVDAVLPGDWISELSRKEDYTEASDLVGGMEPGFAKSAVDIAGGIATDPLTYIGLGPIVKGGVSVAKSIPGVATAAAKIADPLAKAASGFRGAVGADIVNPAVASAIQSGKNAETVVSKAVQGSAIPSFADVTPETFRKAQFLINDIEEIAPNKLARIGIDSPDWGTKADQMKIIEDRLAKVNWSDAEKNAVRDYLTKSTDLGFEQWAKNVEDISAGGRQIMDKGITAPGHAPMDYHPRAWEMDEPVGYTRALANVGKSNVSAARTITKPEQFIKKYEELVASGVENPLQYTDPQTLWAKYGENVARKSKVAKSVDELTTPSGGLQGGLNKSDWSSKAIDTIKSYEDIGDYDTARALKIHFFGMEPREGMLSKGLAKVNQAFKPFATAGSVIPRTAFNVRNAISSAAQVTSNPEARKVLADYATTIPSSVAGGAKDWLNQLGANLSPNRFKTIEDIAARTGGNESLFISELEKADKTLAEAFRNGVLDSGFTSVEQNIARTKPLTSTWDKVKNVINAPQAWAHGTESRIRMGLFDSLRKAGVDEQSAAKIVKDTFYDYNYSSEANRAIRDVVPFAQFTMKAAPQFGKLATENSVIGRATVPAVGALYRSGDEEHPLPQYLANQPTIGIGSENGVSHYLSSLGMPFEALGSIPNPSDDLAKFGRQTEQGIVSQFNPALKFGYSMVAGHDPYFGSDFASYNNTPDIAVALGAPEKSEASRYYNLLASTGMMQPLASPVQTLSQAVDPDTNALEKLLNVSGLFKVATVNDQQALQQQISNYLATNPKAQEYRAFYTRTNDEDTLAAIAELQRIKNEMRAKKKAGQ